MGKGKLIAQWSRLGLRDQLLLGEAIFAVTAACAVVRVLPFRRAVRLGSRALNKRTSPTSAIVTRARWSVETAARILPFRAVCLQQGLALQWMLRRRNIDAVLHYGVAIDGPDLRAHVWVAAGERVVLGGDEAPKFRRLATYP